VRGARGGGGGFTRSALIETSPFCAGRRWGGGERLSGGRLKKPTRTRCFSCLGFNRESDASKVRSRGLSGDGLCEFVREDDRELETCKDFLAKVSLQELLEGLTPRLAKKKGAESGVRLESCVLWES
jgi:hypothetical protein